MFVGAPPPTIEFEAEGRATGKVVKAKLTKEERKALPKPSLAEKAQKANERVVAAQAKAAKLAAVLAAAS